MAHNLYLPAYQRLIYAIPQRAGLDSEQAADVFQEVFLALFEKPDHLEQPDRLQAWLVTTAKYKTLSALSKQKRGPRISEISLDEEISPELVIPDASALPDEALARLEEQHLVRAALAALDERCRRLLTLLFYTNETPAYKEVAQQIGLATDSIGPVRNRCLKESQKRWLRLQK